MSQDKLFTVYCMYQRVIQFRLYFYFESSRKQTTAASLMSEWPAAAAVSLALICTVERKTVAYERSEGGKGDTAPPRPFPTLA